MEAQYVLSVVCVLLSVVYLLRRAVNRTEIKTYNNGRIKPKHLWGYSDTEFIIHNDNVVLTGDRYPLCNKELPHFLPFVKTKIGGFDSSKISFENNISDIYNEIDLRNNHEHLNLFINMIGTIEFSVSAEDRLYHSHGQMSVEEIYKIMYSDIEFQIVDIVVFPKSEEEIMHLMEICNSAFMNVKYIPYGGGTNVTGCLKVVRQSNELVASVSMKNFNIMKEIDFYNQFAIFGAGITGKQLEEYLSENGHTMGHEPDSFEFSTLGGWISTYASGMKRAKYGNIEDIVIGFTGISPSGKWNTHYLNSMGENQFVRSSQGVDPKTFFFGSEGNFGIITWVTVKIRPIPEIKKYQSIIFKNMTCGVDFLMDLHDSEAVPASIRLVDNMQFQMGQALKPKKTGFINVTLNRIKNFMIHIYLELFLNFNLNTIVAATVVLEGSKEAVKYQESVIEKLTDNNRGIMGGSENGKNGYLLTNAIAYIRDFVNAFNVIAETFETSCVWEDIIPMTDEMNKRLEEIYQEGMLVKTKPFMTFRITQLYNSGVCIYFTLAIHHDADNIAHVYNSIEKEMRAIMSKYRTSISHHHGIGKLKSDLLNNDKQMNNVVRSIKQTLDPNNVMWSNNNIFNTVHE